MKRNIEALTDPAEVRAHLVGAAAAGEAITSSELLGQLRYVFFRSKMRRRCKTLGAVDDEAAARGEPELAVLVVRQSDGLPGQGWWVEGARAHGYAGVWEGPDAAKFIRRLQQKTFDYWAMAEAGASG